MKNNKIMKKSKVDLIELEMFKNLVLKSNSIREILDELGYSNTSGTMHKKVKERISYEGLNIDHMGKKIDSRGGRKIIPLNEILVENSQYNRFHLKVRLINENILEYKCEKCNNIGEWLGELITLHLDHKNGVNDDNRIENLRFLCPNCHSQTPTFGGKNVKH